MNLPLINLYETDFYAWTQKQVELLRQRDLNNLDIENLIEEINSLGKQEKQELVVYNVSTFTTVWVIKRT